MANINRLFLTLTLIFAGTLLVLAGFSLVDLSLQLLLYLGIGLLILAVLVYFLGRKREGGDR